MGKRRHTDGQQVTSKAKQLKDSVTCPPGLVRLSELKSTAWNSRTSKALSDGFLAQREAAEQAEDAQGAGHPQAEDADAQGAVVSEGRPRRRSARLPEAAPPLEPQERVRGRRQRDFDMAEQNESSGEESQRKEGTRAAEEPWTQNQQKLLELALQQYPRGSPDRWDKIARCVPSRSKEDCITRYKLLVELVQKKKQAKT